MRLRVYLREENLSQYAVRNVCSPSRIWMYTYGNDFRSLYALLISKAHKTQATATEDVAVGCPFGLCQ